MLHLPFLWGAACYGCHVKVDYSGSKTRFDWLAAGHRHQQRECEADRGEGSYDLKIPGELSEEWSFTRWEDPALGLNGEGRISPIALGCQASFTVLGKEGQPIFTNRAFRTLPNVAGAGTEGQTLVMFGLPVAAAFGVAWYVRYRRRKAKVSRPV